MPDIAPYNSDNERFVHDAVTMVRHQDLSPHWFGIPGSTTIYPLAATFAATNRIDRALGAIDQFVGPQYDEDPTAFYAIGRIYAALFGAASVSICYVLGKTSSNRLVGLVAAGILTISPLHTVFSHMARPDTIGVFCSSLGILASVTILDRPRWRYYLLAGAAFGLGVASKYYMILLSVALPLIHLVHLNQDRTTGRPSRSFKAWAKLGVGLALIPLVFALTNPYLLLEIPTVMKDLMHERRTINLTADGLNPWQNAWWYLTRVVPGIGFGRIGGVGLIGSVLAAIGVMVVFVRRNPSQIVLLVTTSVFLVGISSQALHWDRWAIPLLPFFAILAGIGLEAITSILRLKGLPQWANHWVTGLIIVVISMQPLDATIQYNTSRTLPNARQLAQEWIETSLPPDSRIIAETGSIPISPERFAQVDIVYSVGLEPLEYYCENEYDYLVFTSLHMRRYATEREVYPQVIANYDRIQSELTLERAIEAEPGKVVGPAVYIYRVSDCP